MWIRRRKAQVRNAIRRRVCQFGGEEATSLSPQSSRRLLAHLDLASLSCEDEEEVQGRSEVTTHQSLVSTLPRP